MDSPSKFYSQGDPRSWIDLVTNNISLSSIHLEQDLDLLLGYGITPSHLFPAIVHEYTHHWCFLSPVGSVLSYLELRARKNGVLLYNKKGGDKTPHQMLGDVVRYESALSLLKPLAEGLAVFAEFDAISGPDSKVFSEPAELVGWLFSGGMEAIKYGPFYFPYEGTRRPFMEWRKTEQCFNSKCAMLGHAFEVDQGGYLPGYLTVRQLWLELSAKNPRIAQESDLFLTFIRSFFFDDYELVSLLLDESPVEFATSEAILTHIAGRFDQFKNITEKHINRYESAIASGEYRSEGIEWLHESIINNKTAANRGYKMLQELNTKLETPDLTSVDGLLTLYITSILKNRDIVNFGHLDVQVEVDNDAQCRVISNGKTIRIGRSLPNIKSGSSSGSLDLLCSVLIDAKIRAVTVHRGTELVAIFFAGPDERNMKYRQRFIELEGYTGGSQLATEEMKYYLDNVLTWDGIAEIISEMRTLVRNVSNSVYMVTSFPHLDKEKRARIVDAMRDDGLLPILNWDRSLVSGVALISLAWSLRLRRPQIIELFNSYGMELEPTLEAIKACCNEYGVPEIQETDDLLLCSF